MSQQHKIPRPVDETAAVAERITVDVRSLMSGAREAILTLDGEEYRLRITAKEKLILTK